MALGDKVLPQDFVVDVELATAIRSHCKDGKLPCSRAFALAKVRGTPPLLIGQAADSLNIHLSHCQLGLFGYPHHKKGWPPQGLDVSAELKAIIQAAVNDGQLTCTTVWAIAAQLHIPKMQVSYAADQMDVRLIKCQLGAF